jgi:hypothetical protein
VAAAHLAACDVCSARLDLQRRLLADVDAELERALAVTASPELVTGVTARVAASATAPATWRPTVTWMGLAAAAAIAGAVYVRTPSETAPPRATSVAVAPAPAPRPAPPGAAAASPRPAPRRPTALRHSTRSVPLREVARHSEEPSVMVDRSQLRAIIRLQELLMAGRLNEDVLPPARPHDAAELTVSPLTVRSIDLPDVDRAGRAPAGGQEQQ